MKHKNNETILLKKMLEELSVDMKEIRETVEQIEKSQDKVILCRPNHSQ